MKMYRPVLHRPISRKSFFRWNSTGFTLIELMVGVAIVAIMAAAAVPAVNSYFTRHALQYATDELFGDIQLARMRAARNNQTCRIQFNVPALNQYTLLDVPNAGVATAFKTGNLGTFRDAIRFTNSPSGADAAPLTSLDFLPQGNVNPNTVLPVGSNSVFLTNRAGDVFYRVIVSLAGGTGVDRWQPNLNRWR